MIAVKIAAEKAKRTRRSPIVPLNRFLVRDRVDWGVSPFLGSTGYQPVVAGSVFAHAKQRRRRFPVSASRRDLQPSSHCSPETRGTQVERLAGDCAQLFRDRFTFSPIVDHERIIFAVSGPRTAGHFPEIYKLPVGYVCFL